jgi:hypothetical protein
MVPVELTVAPLDPEAGDEETTVTLGAPPEPTELDAGDEETTVVLGALPVPPAPPAAEST